MQRVVLAFWVLGLGAAWGQDKYAAEPLVVLHNDRVYRMEADGTGVMEQSIAGRIQSEAGLKQVGVLAVPFASKSQHVEWDYARVKHADGTVVETPVSSAIEVAEQVTREAPFYSDLKESQLPLKDLRVGDTLEWRARVVMTTPEAEGNFWGQENFAEGAVVLEQTIEVNAPKGIYLNAWGRQVKPVETIAGDTQTWRWTNAELKPTVGPEADAAKEAEKKRLRTPDEEVDERQGKLPDVAWTTFKSWKAVGAWYRELEGERMQPDAAVKAKVAQLIAGKTTEEEKVKAVYSYVSLQIHYVGVSLGIGRYQPHAAGEVMENQYGDCKDKHTLLAAMLGALGLHPDAVLIGAGIRFNQAVPSPGSFNHLITRVEVSGKPVWLDSTAEVAPYGMLLYGIRDRSALVVPDTGAAKVETTPALPPYPPMQTMDAVGTLDVEGNSNSKITFTFRGDDEVMIRSVVRRISPSQYEQMAKGMFSGIGYQGEPSHVEVNRPEDMSVPMMVTFDYKRVKGGDWPNHRVMAQLAPVLLPKPDASDPPVEAVELGVARVESSKATMKLPEGWGVVLPDAIHEKCKWATLDETYRFKDGVLSSERRLEVLKDRVPQSEWKEYAKFTQAIDLGNERYVQLVPHDATEAKTKNLQAKPPAAEKGASEKETSGLQGEPGRGVPMTALADADPALLVRQARSMVIVPGQEKTAAMMLNSVKMKHPEQQGLWIALGDLAAKGGKSSEAIDDYRKELSLHPAEYETYGPLAEAQWTLKERGDAEATLHTWMSDDPKSSEAAIELTGYLLEDGKPADAVAVAKVGLAGVGENDPAFGRLQVLLGRADLAPGNKDGGRKALVSAIKTARDAELSNDAAYALADAGMELTLAEVTTAQNVSHMEDESRIWTLTGYPWQMEERQKLLESTWETMAWVLFREGNSKDAESYARAVWMGLPTMLAGEHLGEIEEANGDRPGALRTYEMAMWATGTDADRTALKARIDALAAAGVPTQNKDAAAELAHLRVFSLGPAEDVDGTSDYRVLLNAGKVEAAKSAGGAWVRGGEDVVATASMPGLFPKGSNARLVRHVKLTCKQKVCQAVLGE